MLDDPHLAFVQARCDFLNARENRVTHAQQVILESHFAVEQPTRCWAGQFLPFNGTGGVWRRAAIEAAGGWHGDTLTEDLDLSYRAQMRGWRALYLVSVAVPGELPDSLASWGMQQCRWNKGFAQTTRKLLPSIWRSASAVEAETRCGAPSRWLRCSGRWSLATGILWWIDLLLGTFSYSLVLPLAALGLLQGLAGALAMALLSSNLLRRSGVGSQTRGFMTTCRLTSIYDPDAPICCGAVGSQRDRRHTRPHVGLRANTKTGSSSRLIDARGSGRAAGRACVRNGQAGSRTSVRVPVARSSRRRRHPENIGERISLPTKSSPPTIAGTAGSK